MYIINEPLLLLLAVGRSSSLVHGAERAGPHIGRLDRVKSAAYSEARTNKLQATAYTINRYGDCRAYRNRAAVVDQQ